MLLEETSLRSSETWWFELVIGDSSKKKKSKNKLTNKLGNPLIWEQKQQISYSLKPSLMCWIWECDSHDTDFDPIENNIYRRSQSSLDMPEPLSS